MSRDQRKVLLAKLELRVYHYQSLSQIRYHRLLRFGRAARVNQHPGVYRSGHMELLCYESAEVYPRAHRKWPNAVK